MSLTEEKSAFAAANHGLVHSFLKERELPEDEYYDTVFRIKYQIFRQIWRFCL